MLVRTIVLLLVILTASSPAQIRLFGPPKAKVVKPAAPATPGTPAATATPGAVAPTPKPRKRATKPANPLTAYMPSVKAAFAQRWSEAVAPLMKTFDAGNLVVAFKLDAEGKVTAFEVTQNTSNPAFAKFCEEFVRETEYPKPPAKALVDGVVEIPFTFSIL